MGYAVMRVRYLWIVLGVLLLCPPAFGLDPGQFREMFIAENYRGLADLCESSAAEIDQHEYADRILYYCGMAKVKVFEESGSVTDITEAIETLERSLYLYYLPGTGFSLGQARLAVIDQTTGQEEKRALQWQALGEMWDAIVKRHAEENFSTDVVSDAILKWSVDYQEAIVDRMLKEQEDAAVVRWLTARIRMLTDRYKGIDPSKGESEIRRTNLETISGWMNDFYETTYFDRNPVVGTYKYMGDRREGEYDQTEATQEKFHKALYYYNQGLVRARTLKAKAVLHERIAYLCSLYQSEDKDKKIQFYKQGFNDAASGLVYMDRIAKKRPEKQQTAYRFEPDNTDLTAELQKHYGRNLSGLLYFLWERGDFKEVVAYRKNAYDTGFDWKTKADDLLRIADAAAKLARRSVKDRMLYDKYKQMSLTSASRAFKFTLKKFKGRMPTNDESFCNALSAYSTFLASFGETVESTNLDLSYGSICNGPPDSGTEVNQ